MGRLIKLILVLQGGGDGQGTNLTSHLDLMVRLRVNGAISLLSLYGFMEWTGTALPYLHTAVTCWDSVTLAWGTAKQVLCPFFWWILLYVILTGKVMHR